MMRYLLFVLAILSADFALGQITATQQKSLNNLIDYANQSADEVTATTKALIDYYPTMFEKRSWGNPRFVCPVQLDEYYIKKAQSEIKAIGSAQALSTSLAALKEASEKIDKKCKALDTYHKLEDFKKDNFAEARKIISEFLPLQGEYTKARNAMMADLQKAHRQLNAIKHPYTPFDEMLRKQLKREADFLDQWKFNLKEEIHTGWIVEQLEESILETDSEIKKLQNVKAPLTYPASSMWPSFVEGLISILEVKRSALDEYNHQAKSSDKHSNDVYLSLINYYNGVLVADYNALLGYASNDKFFGLKAVKYVPVIEIRSAAIKDDLTIKAYSDAKHTPLQIIPQKMPVAKTVFSSLNNYVEYINETWRQVSNHRDIIRNLNSSAAYYATLTDFTRKGGISFKNDGFEIPLSYYQKAVAESSALPQAYSSSLNKQSEVLLNILKEMNQIATALETETKEKRYEKDRCKYIYVLLERTKVLFDDWDEKKERLYDDVRLVFDSYPAKEPSNSWTISGKKLWELNQLDHAGLFSAKAFYGGKAADKISTQEIDDKVREVIAGEYENMKGIQKYGRNNGLCPYTPYEDLPKSSKYLSEELSKLKPAKENQNGYDHPYHAMVYQYNDVVRYYNKFAELSPMPLLQNIMQPELFSIVYPKKAEEQNPLISKAEEKTEPKIPKEEPVNDKPVLNNTPDPQKPESQVKVIRDTVYIEKRDTVFLVEPNEDLRSMEGYATNNMVLLLDVSGSMNSPEKLPLLKQSVTSMLSMMRPEDEISIVVFSGKPKVLLTSTSFRQEDKIKKAISSLKPSGTTDGNAGLKLAYKVADENYIRGGNNRIILATDGEFNISDDSRKLIEEFSRQDIFISVFNFGKKTSMSKNLESIASLGKGNYEFIAKDNVELKLIREAKSKKKR